MYDDCKGCFLTDPGSVRLYLTDINEFFKDHLPQKAMIFLNSDVTDDSISHLVSEIITLTHMSIESSLIATCWDGESESLSTTDNDENESLISIPINLDIVVDVINDDDSDYEDLYDNTMELFDNFNPLKVRTLSSATSSHSVSSAPVHKAIRAGYEFRGLEIQRPMFKKFARNSLMTQDIYEDIDKLAIVQGKMH